MQHLDILELRLLGENMSQVGFYGTYARFVTEDRDDAAAFLGADNIIGDAFSVEMDYSTGERIAWIVNPFGKRMGVLDKKIADKIDLANAKGWTTVALLALVAFTEEPAPGYYWGQVMVISYDPQYKDAFSSFVTLMGKKLGSGIRPSIDLGQEALNQIIANKGNYMPSAREPLPKKKKGTALVKTERSSTERLVEQARKGNIGCTIGSWVFLLAIVAAIVFGLHSCGLF